MSTDRLKALEEQLGKAPPRALAALDEHHLSDLAEAVESARRRQAAELTAAAEQALRHIPKLLRVPVRKVLG